jgi:hypothetical protein
VIGRGTLLWLALATGAGAGLFHVSYRVQSLEEDLTQANRDILREQETIHLLRAEWSYLNEPTRLAEMTSRHLALTPLSSGQMVRIEDLPLRLPPLIAETAPLKDDGGRVAHSSATVDAAPAAASIADLIKQTSGAP